MPFEALAIVRLGVDPVEQQKGVDFTNQDRLDLLPRGITAQLTGALRSGLRSHNLEIPKERNIYAKMQPESVNVVRVDVLLLDDDGTLRGGPRVDNKSSRQLPDDDPFVRYYGRDAFRPDRATT